MKRENERQIKKNLSKILGVLVLCLIMPLLFSISAEAKEAEESQQQEKVQQTERINEINTFEDFFILSFTTLEGFAICISFFFIVVICEVGVVAVVLSSFLSSFLFSIVTSFDFASNKKFLIELM